MKKALFSLLAAAIAAAVPVRAIILAALAALLLAAPPARATTGELLTRFGLDDATQYAVTDAAILDGLPAGATAIRVPKGVSVDLAIPPQLKDAPGHPYTLVLKIKITDASSGWVCLANMPDSNDSDAMIYLHKDTRKVCIKQFDKGSVSATSNTAVQKNRWTVLAFAFGAGTTTVYMDGDPIYSGSATLANSFADCYRAGDYILVGADNDGDDNPFFLADARIYDGAVAVADELPGTGIEEDPFRIASVADWELLASNVSRGMALGDDFPYYRLVADIGSAAAPVTRSVGTDAHPFCGDFDGGSHTIRVALSGSASGTAPFARTDGARIHDLKVAGSVSSAANHAAGLVGLCAGQTVLQRCDVSADVAVSGAGYAGGIVGHGGSGHGLTVFDSLYTGTISGFTAHAGGLVGWCDSLSAMYLGDCLFKGSFAGSGSYHPIACRSAGSLFPVYLTGDTVYYPNTVPPTEDDDYVPFKGTPVSETLVPDEWDVPVTAVDGNVYYLASAIAITPETGDLLLRNGDVLSGTGGPDTRVLVADGATVTLRNVCITNITADTSHVWGGITCQGSATIVLQGVNYLRGGHPYVPGLYVPPGKTLVIRGDGTLEAGSNGYGAGIGGGRSASMACGDIVIEGGTIVATGGDGAAGIGSGPVSTCGTITVSGGSVTATGGNAAAGIGAGQQGTNGTVTVTGGIVDATGGPYGAGIGSGYQAVCGDIAVSGGTVAATGGQYAAGIGSGLDGTCGDITLSGGTVSAAGGQRAPGIGSGASQTSSGVTATCGDIALEEGVVRVTADGGGRAAVGAGNNSTAGAVTVGGAATTVSDTHYVYAPCVLSIATTADWDAFASRVNRGVDSYDGLTVTLAADIAVSTPVGTNQAFRGTFDGGGHTLAVEIEGTGTWTAPFRYIDGATIANLTVTGTVTSGGNHAAGLVGACGPSRPNTIRNCTVSVDVVADGTGYAGGIVGQGGDSTLTLAGCVFSGSVSGFTAFAGGLLGWGNSMTLGIADCLVTGAFAPAGNGKFHPIACKFANRTVTATVSGAYWINAIVPTATGDNLVAGAAGAPVSATLVPGEWESPVAAADGNTYYAWTPAPAGRLLAHLAFDDAGNAGTNLLRAAVGLDAIVRATPTTPVAGIGEIAAVSDAGILSGLAEGDGAVAIPLGQHLAVPIPAPLLPAAGRPYTVVMKIRVPDNTGWRSLLNMPASNDSDAMVYLQQTTRNIYLKQFDKSSGAGIAASNGNVAADRWTTLAFAFGENATDIYRDGTPVLHATGALAGSYADCAASGGYVLVGADDSGDDNLFYLSDFRIYDGAVALAGVLPGSGTPDDPYLISSTDDWNAFAANVRGGFGSGCYRLAADIGSVAVPAGADGAPFSGTFNGGGHTLTVALSGTDPYVAPFAAISGATISNLVVAGTVGGGMHCSGLVGLVAGGTNTIENCRIAAAISTSRSHFGGIVGHGYVADTTLRGCVFSGSLSGGTYVATFNAWSDDGATTRVVDCLDASASAQPIGRGADAALVSNAYYAATKNFSNGERLWSAGNRGTRAYAVTEGEGVTIDFGAPVATYAASGIAVYAPGIVYEDVFYAGAGETVSLGLSATPPFGEALDGFAASAGTLAADGGAWTLAMPAANVVVTASLRSLWAGSGTAAAPFRIATVADWNALADVLDNGADTAGKHFLLATNLSVTTMLGYGSASPFKGVFDGGGHTLTVSLTGTERYVAPFSAISGATISNLVVAGTVGGDMHCAGLVGSVVDGSNTIEDCEVAAAISSSGTHFGCIVGHGLSAETTLRGCVFSGTLSGSPTVATLFGWGDSPTVTVVDCFDASASSYPIGRSGGTVSVANTYFRTRKTYIGSSFWYFDNRGRRAFSVTAAEGVAIDFGAPTKTYPATGLEIYATGIAREGVFYAGEGETVALSLALTATPPEGMVFAGYSPGAGTLSPSGDAWTLAMAASDSVVSAVFRNPRTGSGTAADPYRIADTWDWNVLADLVAGGEDTAGKHYLLLSNIVASASIGTAEHPFAGVFDGGGHTLTANLSGPDAHLAPFSVVSGATISNLAVVGSVAGADGSAGLVGLVAGGENLVADCAVAANVSSTGGRCGGIVGDGGSAATTLAGCLFSGSLSGATDAGTLLGASGAGASATVSNCLDASTSAFPLVAGSAATAASGAFYLSAEKAAGPGRRAFSVTAGEGVTIDFGAPVATYGTSGIAAYETGIARGVFYAGEGDAVSLSLAHSSPPVAWQEFDHYDAGAGTLAADGGAWTLAMPAADVVVNAAWRVAWAGAGTAADPYRIERDELWNGLAAEVAAGIVTAGKHYLLVSNIVAATSVGTEEHPFAGVFDGGGKTLAASLYGYASAPHLAPFRAISGATISNLVVAGKVIGGAHSAGLVGKVVGGTNLIENCLVSAEVSAHNSPYGAGIVGHGGNSGATTIAGCVFAGSLSASGGDTADLWGWSDGPDPSTGAPGADVTIVDCFARSARAIGRGGYASLRVENVYMMFKWVSGAGLWPADKRGKYARSVTAGVKVSIDFGEPAATYATSGIVAYGPGIRYNGVFYAAEGETVPLSLSSTTIGTSAFEADQGVLAEDGDGWILTMPDEDVVVSAIAPRYAVTIVPVAGAVPADRLIVDGAQANDFSAPEGAAVSVLLAGADMEWAVESASVVAEGGAVVPCTVEPLDFDRFAVRFTMPGVPVSVTPAVTPVAVRSLQLGENTVSGPGFYVFVAPESAEYSFAFGDGDGWRISDIVDEMLEDAHTYGNPLASQFAAGSTHCILVDGPDNGETATLTIARTGNATAYSVTVVSPEHGTLVSSVSEAPDGCCVYFTAVPDPDGWELVEVLVLDSRGWEQPLYPVQDPFRGGTVWQLEMGTYPVTASATFSRKIPLVVGENPVLFEYGMPDCTFVAPEDGWYRFRSTNEVAVRDVQIRDADGNRIEFDFDVGSCGGFDGIARLEAGSLYLLSIDVNDHSVDGTILVGRCTVHAVAVDGNAAHGRVAALDMDGDPVVEALEGSRVRLWAEADAGYDFGGWSVVDATGASVPVCRDDLNDLWFFRMSGTNVAVSALFGGPHEVRIRSTAQVLSEGSSVNDLSPEFYHYDSFDAVEGAEVAVYYSVCVGWDLPSAAVVTALGETVPCTIGRDAFEDCVLVRFRMPDVDVVVTPLPVRCEGPELHLGDNEIGSEAVCRFVAPTSGEYSFHLADSSDWDLELFDDLGNRLGMAKLGGDASVILAMGSVLNVRPWQYGFGAATVTVSRVGDAVLYPVSVAPTVGGTVEPSDAKAPEGRDVRFAVAPDPGWELAGVRATGPNGNESYQAKWSREGLYTVRMPAAAVVFEATFERSRELVVGVNPTLFESSMRPRTFVAPKDGWYRFRTTCGGGLSGMFVRDNDGELDFDSGRDENGDIDGIVRLSGGSSYYVDVYFYPEDPVEASIVVGLSAAHGVESDPDIAHGRVEPVDFDGNPVDEALEGARILLDAEPDNGYALAAWNVVDATGAPVPVRWDFDEEITYFRMPGTNVLVSATFSRAHALTLETPGPTYVEQATANEIPVAPNRYVAAAGAEVRAAYWVASGWTIQTFVVETADGAAVPFATEPDDYGYVLVRFTMPASAVAVTPVPVRADLPELVLGTNAIAAAGVWRFVPPTNGVYSFTLADPQDWDLFLEDDWGYAAGETWGAGNIDVALVQGVVYCADLSSRGGGATTLTIERIDDAALYPVVIDAAHATVGRQFDAAPAGRTFPFTLVASPGWAIADVVATDADGTELDLTHWNTQYYFEMPASAVTVTATFAPALPWYLDGAGDEILWNYDAWAARYGADPLGTNLVAFLLDADPAVAVPAGAEPLKVVDFALANGVLRFEIASEWVAFQNPNPPPPGVVRVTSWLGNGILVLRSAPSLPCDDADWEESLLRIVDWLPDGHVVAEFEPKRGASALPARFFRPAISTVAPDDDSGGQVH